ncbi:NAD-dependent epimerase/dehydratase family protein [Kribbella capetownensis]|uniref:NAD-dependent epimerase/dehydratase family protein n=1 Tax=Kribbella capetownensis TaxID=1572659 RepID=A0A4V2M7H9_9ACTN|nr:NAD(P)H-binding protein [Kribbella capetownensis]TCC47652.1 NAD-dependent epimerase/dehydratase family protein [Kribbella capetownensis]
MIVITGATGNVGRPLVRALTEAGEQVTAVARGITDVPAGIRRHQADLAEPESLKPALEGAQAIFLLTSGDFVTRGNLADVVQVVRGAGVERIVLLSSQGVGTQRHPSYLEDAVIQSGLEWTMLRPGNFSSNAFQWAESVRTERTVSAPFGDVALPAVDPDDIAEVAAVALREPGHAGAIYTLTGPVAVSPSDQAAAIGDALGEPVRFVELSRAEARTRMLGYMPEQIAESTLDILGTPSAAEQHVSPDVEKVLGRPAGTFAEWAARNVEAFR